MTDTETVADAELNLPKKKRNWPPQDRGDMIKTEEGRVIAQQMLRECLEAYRKEKVKSDAELLERLDEYFVACSTRIQYPTVEEMYMWTGYDISTVGHWIDGSQSGFSPETRIIIKKARNFLQNYDAKMVQNGQMNFLAYCFRAKNFYEMSDKTETTLSINPDFHPVNLSDIAKRYEVIDSQPTLELSDS